MITIFFQKKRNIVFELGKLGFFKIQTFPVHFSEIFFTNILFENCMSSIFPYIWCMILYD